MSSFAPITILDVFNPANFASSTEPLTQDVADQRYLQLTGGTLTGKLYCNGGLSSTTITGSSIVTTGDGDFGALKLGGVAVDVSSITGVTAGTILASKAVIVDANKDVSSFRNLTSTGTLSGTTLACTGSSINLSNTTTLNNTIMVTSGSTPSTGNGLSVRFSGIASTGYMRSYNYITSQYNNIAINDTALYVKANGYIGIGNSSPLYKLDVSGGTIACSQFYAGNNSVSDVCLNLTQFHASNACTFQMVNQGGTVSQFDVLKPASNSTFTGTHNTHNWLRVNTNGQVGLGQDSLAILDNVELNIRAGNLAIVKDASNTARISIDSVYAGGKLLAFDTPIHVTSAATYSWSGTTKYLESMSSGLNGHWSVSAYSTAFSAYLDGSLVLNQDVISFSDRRLKSDIVDYQIDIEDYKKFRPRSYHRTDTDIHQIGLIAQEVASCAPELIRCVPNADMIHEMLDDPDDGVQLCLTYDRLPIVNMSVIQQLLSRVEELESDIADLKSCNDMQADMIHEMRESRSVSCAH